MKSEKGKVKIIFEDPHLLVIDKPPGLVTTKSETTNEETLEDWLSAHYDGMPQRMGIVHRLDKNTSGLIVVAKTAEALENLQSQFKSRITKKEYLALVHGHIMKPGKVEGSIGRNPGNREKFTVLEGDPTSLKLRGAREAVTEYEPLERLQVTGDRLQEIFPDFNKIQMRKLLTHHYLLFTLVACQPKTGRTHQIRVHLKYIGHPIVSDEKYVGKKMYRLDHRWCPRQFLHAAKLGFRHPSTGQWMEMESALPEDLKKAIKLLSNAAMQQ